MLKMVSIVVLLVFLPPAVASAWAEILVLAVEKPVSTESLRSAGLLYLGDVGEMLIVEGDGNSAVRMLRDGVRFHRVLSIRPGQDVFLLKRRGPWGGGAGQARSDSLALVEVGDGTYIAAIHPRKVALLDRLPFAKVRLMPTPFRPGIPGASFEGRSPAMVDPTIEAIVGQVSGDSLWTYISQLSGREPVVIGTDVDTLLTRYSLGEGIDRAAEYLKAGMEGHGMDVEFDPYVMGQLAFYSASFPDLWNGWVVGNDRAAYRTRDGGLSWERQEIAGSHHSLWGVFFVDADRGWICGTGGNIYRTRDGGLTWSGQESPSRVTLREICFVDSLKGWVVGDGGEILRTTDGGRNWIEEESGTKAGLHGLDFRSPERGWACGEDGVILFWDGLSWEGRVSGTSEDLMDIEFGGSDTGWAVGWGGTILRTESGGLDWSRQEAPSGTASFLNGVAAAGPFNAWIVGLNGTILHSSDGGETWEPETSGTLFGLACVRFAGDSQGWTVGYGSTVLKTDDGGATWQSMREYLPSEAILTLKNVVGTLPGTKSDKQVIMCGHFDSISEDPSRLAPGADDNATGTAAVMEAARILSGYRFERTIRFICFSGEEQGLFGSGEYVSDPQHAGHQIAGVLNLDMIGYVDIDPEDVDIVGNAASEWLIDLVADCAGIYVPSLEVRKIIDPTMVFSDHASFWKGGHSAVLAIEDLDIQYPYYHTTGDTLGNLNKPFAAEVVRIGLAALCHLARPDTVAPDSDLPVGIEIRAAVPNPFKVETGIRFSSGARGDVEIAVLDARGRRVATLIERSLPAGRHIATWDGCDAAGRPVAAGIYFVTARLGDDRAGHKIVLLR